MSNKHKLPKDEVKSDCTECIQACSSECECWCHEAERISSPRYYAVFTVCNICDKELIWQAEDQCGMCKKCMNSQK